MPYPFLSDEWIEAAHALRDEFPDAAPSIAHAVKMNLVVTEMPFGDGEILAHMDTTSGDLLLDKGHLDGADLTGADLSGVTTLGQGQFATTFVGTVWSDTTCPDGTNSDSDGGACAGDLG